MNVIIRNASFILSAFIYQKELGWRFIQCGKRHLCAKVISRQWSNQMQNIKFICIKMYF